MGLFLVVITLLVSGDVVFQSNNATAEEEHTFQNVAIESAAEITGYDIAKPSFIPTGFLCSDTLTVSTLGQGKYGDFPKHVEQRWTLKGDLSIYFVLVQSPKRFGLLKGEVTEINGITVQKAVGKDEFGNAAIQMLVWEKDNMYYGLAGSLKAPLDEEILYKIADSVKINN